MARWTFLTNHALVFLYLAKHPRITALDLSRSIGITERAVRKIIADLEEEKYIAKEKEGRRIKYSVNPRLPLRHPTQQDRSVRGILDALGWQEGEEKK